MSLEDRHSIACWLEGYQEHEPGYFEVRAVIGGTPKNRCTWSEEEYLRFEENSPTRTLVC